MGKRGRRRKRQAAHERGNNFTRAIEQNLKVYAELAAGATPEQLVHDKRAEARELIAQFDAVHLLGFALLSEAPLDPNSYVESEHEGAAFVVELVAAECLRRESRAGEAEIEPVIDKTTMDRLRALVREATIAESIRRRGATSAEPDAERRARDRAALHHLTVRNPGWSWQEERALRELFGDKRTTAMLVERFGFGIEDALRCVDALLRWPVGRMQDHMASALGEAEGFSDDHPAQLWVSERATVPPGLANDPNRIPLFLLMWASQHVGDAMLISAEDLAIAADADVEAAAAFLDTFAQSFGQDNDDWFAAAEHIRWKPLIRVDDESFLLTIPDNLLWSIRREFEKSLSDNAKFLKHRGDWVESRARQMLEDALEPEESYSSVDFEFKDEDGCTVKGEIDVLLRVGDVAIVCEGKSARMKEGALRGGQALIDFMKKNVSKAAEQTTNAREALRRPGSLTLDGKPLSLGATIREVHPVVVTLSDLSAIAPVIWEFSESLTMPDDVTIPWLVTLNELDSVTQTVEWPSQFIHFLRRRARLNERAFVAASDELDWWMHYLLYGLYFEDEEEVDPVFVASLTDPLDAWMMFTHGDRTKPAPMPAMKLDSQTREMLDALEASRQDARVSAACTMLEMSGKSRLEFWKSMKKIRGLARARSRTQRFVMAFEDGVEPMMVAAVAVPDSEANRVADAMESHVAQRIEEFGPRRVLAIGVVASSTDPFEAIGTLERNQLAPPQQSGAGAASGDTNDNPSAE